MKQEKRRTPAAEMLTRALEIPFEVLPGVAKITLSGNLSLTVDGHRGIMDYEDGTVKIALSHQILLISGRNLEISSITADQATVEGHIAKVEFIIK